MQDFIRLAIAAAPFLALLLALNLSNRWVTRKERQLLEKSLGRPMRRGEEDSLSTWLRVPKAQLEEAVQELDKNPFTPIVDVTTSIAWRESHKDSRNEQLTRTGPPSDAE